MEISTLSTRNASIWRRLLCRPLLCSLVLLVAVGVVAKPAALAQERDGENLGEVEQDLASFSRVVPRIRGTSSTDPYSRLRNGVIFLKHKEPERAAIHFFDTVLNHPRHSTHGDALFYLGAALYQLGEFSGAKTATKQYLSTYANRNAEKRDLAAIRLVRIGFRTRHLEEVQEALANITTSSSKLQGTLSYFRGKLAYLTAIETATVSEFGDTEANAQDGETEEASGTEADGTSAETESDESEAATLQTELRQGPVLPKSPSLSSAKEFFARVPRGSAYGLHARYFLGVIETYGGRLPAAAKIFEEVAGAKVKKRIPREIRNLGRLALGRVYFELGKTKKAIKAYESVPRSSKHVDSALFEVAWAYVRTGDAERVEATLKTLETVAPNSPHVLEGRVLLGNMLIKLGRLRRSEKVFNKARSTFNPVIAELEATESAHPDLTAYFTEQVRKAIQTENEAFEILPSSIQLWFPTDPDFERANHLVKALRATRKNVDGIERYITLARAAIAAPTRAKMFGDIRDGYRTLYGLRNRLAHVRMGILQELEQETPTSALASVRTPRDQRKQQEERIRRLPLRLPDFRVRDNEMNTRFQALNKQLSLIEVSLLSMDARLAATQRLALRQKSSDDRSDARANLVGPALESQQSEIDDFRGKLKALRELIDKERIQVGVGDFRYLADQRARERYAELTRREVSVLQGAGRAGSAPSQLTRIESAETKLTALESQLMQTLEAALTRTEGVLAEESNNLASYRTESETQWSAAGGVAGEILTTKFYEGLMRYRGLMLRADLGRADIAWTRKEQHRIYLEILSRERARRMRAVEDTYREALGEAEDEGDN